MSAAALAQQKQLDETSSDSSEEEVSALPEPQPPVNRGRRTSVSAESMDPTASQPSHTKTVIPKTDQQKLRIQQSVSTNFLFKNLDEEQYNEVVDAMVEQKIEAGHEIIKQGGVGDYFYIVETGQLDVYVAKPDQNRVKVSSYAAGGSFGELALMYNAPRAATIVSTTACILWALDRVTFRRILMDSTSRKRRMYELFLEEVPLLTGLEVYERSKIADALESVQFQDGECVIKQGDSGDAFYIVESGEAKVTQFDDKGVEQVLTTLKKGQYFGELALLSDKPRAATVVAVGKLKCATLGKKAFDRLLGPALDIIKRNTAAYKALTKRKSIQDLVDRIEKDMVVK